MPRPAKSYRLFVAARVLRALFALTILALVIFLIWRVYISDILPGEMKGIFPNDALAELYAQQGEDMTLFTQKQSIITRGEKNYGYFSVPRFVFIPEAKQVQVVFRYNNSTLEAVKNDLGLADELPRGEEIFDVSLILRRDLTPDTAEDNRDDSETVSRERIHPTDKKMTTTSLYTYFLYTFEDVSVTDDLLAVYFDIYYGKTPDYSTTSIGQLRLYHTEDPRLPVMLTGKDERALADFKG